MKKIVQKGAYEDDIGGIDSMHGENDKCLEYEGVTKSFRTGLLQRELQMVQFSATRSSCIAILWVSLVSFATVTLYVASQWVFIVVNIYFVIDSVRKLLDIPSHWPENLKVWYHLGEWGIDGEIMLNFI
jgi:hypothetical protein